MQLKVKVLYCVIVFFNCFCYSLFLVNCMTLWYGVSYFSLNHSSQFYVSLYTYPFIYLSLSKYAYHYHFLGEGGDKQKLVLWQTFIQFPFLARSSNPFALFQGFSHRGCLFLSALFSLPPPHLLYTAPSASSERNLIYQILTQMAHNKHAVTVSLLCNPWINSQGPVLNPKYIRTQVRLAVLFV